MATTTANKHGLRAAATERRNKHAQRTPLPPKPGVVADAKEAIAGIPKRARQKENFEEAIQRAQLPSGGQRSADKARAFRDAAVAAGWAVEVKPVDTAAELVAHRGAAEILHQCWDNGVWQYEASTYTYEDRTLKPRNAAGALKLLARSPELASEEMAKVAANKQFKRREPGDGEIKRYKLPFDRELATDEEILTALAGQAVVWFNRLTNKTESAIVGRGTLTHITVNEKGHRIVNVCSAASGYRSFYVEAILKVGRGRTIKEDGIYKVEVE